MPSIPKIAIFAHLESDIAKAVKRAGMETIAIHSIDELHQVDGFILLDEITLDAMEIVKQEVESGKPLLSIADGATYLVETGLIPGLEDNKPAVRLAINKTMPVTPVTIRLSDDYQRNAFTRYLSPKSILSLPVESQNGFKMTLALQQEIEVQGLNVFQYCDAHGQILNHEQDQWAALSNKAGNVMALIPHPEKTPEGDAIFQSMRDYILDGARTVKSMPLYYYPRLK